MRYGLKLTLQNGASITVNMNSVVYLVRENQGTTLYIGEQLTALVVTETVELIVGSSCDTFVLFNARYKGRITLLALNIAYFKRIDQPDGSAGPRVYVTNSLWFEAIDNYATVSALFEKCISGGGGGGLTNPVDYIDFAIPPDPIEHQRLQWIQDSNTLEIGTSDSGDSLPINQSTVFFVKNDTGSAIAKGDLVMSVGTTGNSGNIRAGLAVSDGSVPGYMLLGVVHRLLPNGGEAEVLHFGRLRGINTTGAPVSETWADGDLLYPNPNIPGKLTNALPTGAGLKNPIAIVIHAHTNGSIFVRMSPGHETQGILTYGQFVSRIGSSSLTPGLPYVISDFRSAWYHLDGGTPINNPGAGALFGPQYGPAEPIVVTAITSNRIASLAYSTINPSDILYYDWNAANWATDSFYSDGGTIIEGWRGVITERIDPLRNNRATFNFRAITFRRFGITAPAYNSGTTYNLGDVVRSGNFLFLCKRYSTTGIATSNTERWIPILGGVNINTSKFWATASFGLGFEVPDIDNFDVGYMQINSDGTFQDFLAFPANSRDMDIRGDLQASLSAANLVCLDACVNVRSSALNSTIGSCASVVIEPNVSDCYIPGTNVGLTIRAGSARIVLGIQCGAYVTANNLIIGSSCSGIEGAYSYGFIGSNSFFVKMNSVSNFDMRQLIRVSAGYDNSYLRFSGQFNNSVIGNSWYDVQFDGTVLNSTFGNGYEITRFKGAKACNLGDEFSGNILSQNIENLSGGSKFTDDDYSTATEIYQPGAKVLLLNRNGDKRLQYVDALDNIVIVSNLA